MPALSSVVASFVYGILLTSLQATIWSTVQEKSCRGPVSLTEDSIYRIAKTTKTATSCDCETAVSANSPSQTAEVEPDSTHYSVSIVGLVEKFGFAAASLVVTSIGVFFNRSRPAEALVEAAAITWTSPRRPPGAIAVVH